MVRRPTEVPVVSAHRERNQRTTVRPEPFGYAQESLVEGLIKNPLNLFFLALSFYTRLPVPKNQDYDQLPQASIYLPLVGWVVGGLTGLCFYLATMLWAQSTAVILALIAGILLTGAFHEDGFADVCDGFGGGYDKQRILEIMKDSQIGAYGALGLVLLMSLKISLLSTMPAASVPLLLFAGHSISRFQPLLLMRQYDYARSYNSKVSAAFYKPSPQELLVAGAFAFLPLLLLPLLCSLAIPLIFLVNWRLAYYFNRHIGGYTGDCLGASQQVAEIVFYLGISALWTFT
ncbi:MAG: adenosylcobinamide-GDP ribazoletransferase [Methyloglobulus sp.]|nr:adenosylcobinamide-GDP ribazoletransferase [Methyloglobulus sp.]